MKKNKVILSSLFVVLVFNFFFNQVQANSWESLVERLTKTRAEIEVLSQEVDSMQKEKQSDLDQLLMRKAEIDTQVEREKLRRLQLTEKLKRLEGRVKMIGKSDPKAQTELQIWITELVSFVNESIPFEVESRLQNLERLKERIKKNHEPMEFIMSDLWSFIESEFKLSQSNEYRIVSIDFGDQKKKCEVARLGLMSMFAVTPDGKIRRSVKKNNKWLWLEIESSDQKESILSLVKNLKNKNQTEIYKLPIDVSSGSLVGQSTPSPKNSIKSSSNKSANSKSEGVSL